MYPRSHALQGSIASAFPLLSASLVIAMLGAWGITTLTRSPPDFPRQLARPCTSCYLGAFTPPLQPYVRSSERDGDASAEPATPHAALREAPPDWHLSETTLWITANQHPALNSETGRVLSGNMHRFDAGSNTAPGTRGGWLDPAQAWGPSDRETIAGPGSAGFDAGRGSVPPAVNMAGSDGNMPRWRVAVQRDLGRHFLQIGGFGASDDTPAATGVSAATALTRLNLTPAVTFNDSRFDQRAFVRGSAPRSALFDFDTVNPPRLDAPWRLASIGAPAIQYFPAPGPASGLDLSPANRTPTRAVIAEIAFAPWDRPASAVPFLDLRFAARYGANREFIGISHWAGSANTLVLSLGGALRF